ncbi:beta-lactamase family protein [Aquihabitans sp. G128]|uniref:serine hydrolase domain-containing protein n=1 Tax=Aquihabitans sp. G128 TaxID=2849779 RepID=UPI001C2144A4|nr:serine hydrolase domain-containing protein [Aquihabitans sp. G128]QXC63349.1 beta-lactamase family protein [Aquihabitans sp. G128]
MTQQPQVEGSTEPGFEAVADAFAAGFAHGEVGASCALYVDGQPVVDLWGGIADPRSGAPWTRDTVAIVFSCTKGVSSIVAHMLVERGQLDPDALVTEYWPEFGAAGKEATTVRDVLSHRTGLPVVDGPVTMEDVADPAGMAARLAAQAPLFAPGSAHAYQAVTFSWTFGEIVRRVTGESIGTFVAREVTGPLGLDLWIGLPPELEGRVAPIQPIDVPAELVELVLPTGSLPWRALTLNGLFPTLMAGDEVGVNDPAGHGVELPAANGITNARSLARLYAATIGEVDGVRLLQADTVAAASEVRSTGAPWGEEVAGASWGTGFMRPFPRQPMLGGGSFGHDGAGGSIAFATPERGIAFSHVANQMLVTPEPDPRTAALLAAVEACLG